MPESMTTTKGTITIRSAVPGDAEPLRELRLEALRNHPEAFASDHETAAKETVQQWADRVANYALQLSGMIAIATANDRLIGMTGVFRDSYVKTRHKATIYGVYVNENWRGLRIAEALIDECVGWARAQGLIMVKLGVITANTAAIGCYFRCGFAVYGTDRKVIHYNGVYYDELLMEKTL